jgi:6-pyruvoyltetrahydropterin/6-carboxytetrahydropterin synthase
MGFKILINAPKVKFSACHFLKEPSRCSRLHGHNYYVSVEVKNSLNDNNFVVDFIELEKNLKSIVKPLDHYILIPTESKDFKIKKEEEIVEILNSKKRYVFPISDVCFLPLSATSSELLAKYIHDKLKQLYKSEKIIVKIEETRNTMALYED